MPWGRYESSFARHPKVQRIARDERADAIALHLGATLYCAELLTDGFVPTDVVPRLSHEVGIEDHDPALKTLLKVGLFDKVRGGYNVHDYLDYNPSAAEVKEKRKQATERQRRRRSQTSLDLAVTL